MLLLTESLVILKWKAPFSCFSICQTKNKTAMCQKPYNVNATLWLMAAKRGYKSQQVTNTIVFCWHLLECSNDIDMITNVNLKLIPRHQDALALQSGSRFLPAVTQLQQRRQRHTITSLAGGCCNVHRFHSLQRPQSHRSNGGCLLHCNTWTGHEETQQQRRQILHLSFRREEN